MTAGAYYWKSATAPVNLATSVDPCPLQDFVTVGSALHAEDSAIRVILSGRFYIFCKGDATHKPDPFVIPSAEGIVGLWYDDSSGAPVPDPSDPTNSSLDWMALINLEKYLMPDPANVNVFTLEMRFPGGVLDVASRRSGSTAGVPGSVQMAWNVDTLTSPGPNSTTGGVAYYLGANITAKALFHTPL